jgi:uncharacterized protein
MSSLTHFSLSRFIKIIPRRVRTLRWTILAIATTITLGLGAGTAQIKMDQSMDAFFKTDDPALQAYQVFRYLFGSDESILVMYEPQDGDVFSPASLQKLKQLEDEINRRRVRTDSALNRITRVRSLISADVLESRGNTLISRPFIGENLPTTTAEVEQLKQAARGQKDFVGNWFSDDYRLATLVLQTSFGARIAEEKNPDFSTNHHSDTESESEEDFDFGDETENGTNTTARIIDWHKIPRMERVGMANYQAIGDELQALFREQQWLSILDQNTQGLHYAATGNPWIMHFFNHVVVNEIGMYMGLSVLIIMVMLYLAFHSFSAVIWPMVVVTTSLTWTMGIVGWLGVTMTLMINIIIFLILTVGVAASIHIFSAYKLFLTEGKNSEQALDAAYDKTGLPIFLAALTTMAGMLSLYIVPIVPIQDFALFSALGVFLSLILTLFLLPILISLWAPKLDTPSVSLSSNNHNGFQQQLSRIGDLCQNHPVVIILCFVGVMLIAMSGFSKVFIDTNFISMVKPGNGLQEAYQIVDEKFGGTSSIELVIDTGRYDGMRDPQLLQAMDAFSETVKNTYPEFVSRTRSLVNIAKESYQHMSDGREANYRIPDDPVVLSQALISFNAADPATRRLYVDDEWQLGRLSLRTLTKGSTDFIAVMEQLQLLIDKHFSTLQQHNPKLTISLTGGVPLMVNMTDYIAKNQVKSFLLILAVISVILLLVFGSLKFGLLALIPNLFPIILVFGATGWMGIPLDSDTMLVIPLAIGIAVDDTIHFLAHYRAEIQQGSSVNEAIYSSLHHVGRAVSFTSIVLAVGFLIFVLSVYQPLNNFGILSSIAIFSALLSDLFLLPALLVVFNSKK